MAKKFVEKTFSLEEEEMQKLLTDAQAGSQKAQLKLLEVFDNYLAKYVALLYHGKYNLSEYDVRRFISLYVKDGTVRGYLMRNKLSPSGHKHVQECLRGITYMTQRYGDEEDVIQTVNMAFLHCVSVYKRRGTIPFQGFLYSYYFYVLKKMVDQFLIDQLGRKTFPLISDEDSSDSDFDGDDKPQGFTAPPIPGVEEIIYTEEIDELWVAGDKAYGPFADLNIQERQLLKWRYVDKERSSEIANRITEHQNTVRENFNRIKQKIREAIERDLNEII